ncbi:MAG: HDOD domain-containing protein [Spirochaetales bacterium]|nr:HDOD domain-containing protein [Spirochaetales bacterium]
MGKVFYTYFNSDNINTITNSIEGKKEYSCIIPYHSDDSELLISRSILSLLKTFNKHKYHHKISIIANELVSSADMINITRIFFQEKNYNSLTESDYEKGVEALFNSCFIEDFNKKIAYIKIDLKASNSNFSIKLETNSPINPIDKELIEKTKLLANSNNIYDILRYSEKQHRTTGYGFLISILLLKSMNLRSEIIQVLSEDDKTRIELNIPLNDIVINNHEQISNDVLNEIINLPQFPDSIMRLQKEIMDPEWDYSRISDFILSDSSLTAEVLRLVNSPVYRIEDPIDKVSIAVKKIGINGLKSILYTFGALEILEKNYDFLKIKTFKDHLFQVALISSYLANKMGLDIFCEDIYVAALMHDIGKIIIFALEPEIEEKINSINQSKKLPLDIIDNIFDGYNHSIIGSKLAEKWNFPEKYIKSIKYHHTPDIVPDEYKIITYCVYLGNEIYHTIVDENKYCNIDPDVLGFFNFESLENFNQFIKELRSQGIVMDL